MLFRQLEVGNVKKSDSSVAWVRGEDMVISTRWCGDLEGPPVYASFEACRKLESERTGFDFLGEHGFF